MLLLVLLALTPVFGGEDDGPGDPTFKANDGDLESDVNPLTLQPETIT